MIKLIILFLFCAQPSHGLDADFFKRLKILKKEEKKRLEGASSYTKKREKVLKAKTKQASRYKSVRDRQSKLEKKRDLSFEAEFKKPPGVNSAKLRQAEKYAKRKRKAKQESWADQNLEFGIKVLTPKQKN